DLGPGPPRLLAQPDGIALERLVEAAALRAAGVGGGGGGFGRLAHIGVRFGDLLFPVHGILACSLLRGPYKRNEYRKVILPLTVLRRFDCILTPTKPAVLKEHAAIKAKGENIIRHRLSQITGVPFFNL